MNMYSYLHLLIVILIIVSPITVSAQCLHQDDTFVFPYHPILTMTGNPSTMKLTFTSKEEPTNPSVTYWPKNNYEEHKSYIGNSNDVIEFTYPQDDSIVEYQSFVLMSGLNEGEYYSYCFGNNGFCGESYNYTFKVPPTGDTPNNNNEIDLGSEGSALTLRSVGGLPWAAQNHLFDFIVHYGDLAYNLCTNKGEVGNQFLDALTPVSGSVPYLTTNGNHESNIPVEGNYNPVFYKHWFYGQHDIASQSGSDNIAWYSFDVGTNLHVIVVSVYCVSGVFAEYHDTILLSQQFKWLTHDLKKIALRDESERPWVVVTGHRQIYLGQSGFWHSAAMRFGLTCVDTFCQVCQSHEDGCDFALEPLFLELHVGDYKTYMVYLGHEHEYWRMLPTGSTNGTISETSYEVQESNTTYVNPQAPVYIVSGSAGIQSSVPLDIGYLYGCASSTTTNFATMTATGVSDPSSTTSSADSSSTSSSSSPSSTSGSTTGSSFPFPGGIDPWANETFGNQNLPTVFYDSRASYSVLKVFNLTHLLHTQVSVVDGQAFDELWIVRDNTTALAPTANTLLYHNYKMEDGCDQ